MSIPLPVIANTFRVTFKWSGLGLTGVNVMHFLAGPSGATEAQLHTTLESTVTAGLWTPIQFQIACSSIDVIHLDGIAPTITFPTAGGAKWTGTGTGDALVAPSALIKLTTPLRGPRGRGRVYLPFVAEGNQAGGVMTSGGVTTTTSAAWNTWLAALQSATTSFSLVVASYGRPTTAHPAGWTPFVTAVTSATCETPLATQRRRQGRLR